MTCRFVYMSLVPICLSASGCASTRSPAAEEGAKRASPPRLRVVERSGDACAFGELSADAQPIEIQDLACKFQEYLGQRVQVRGYVITMYDLQSILSEDRAHAVAASWSPEHVLRKCSGRIVDVEGVPEEVGASRKPVLRIIAVRETQRSKLGTRQRSTLDADVSSDAGAGEP